MVHHNLAVTLLAWFLLGCCPAVEPAPVAPSATAIRFVLTEESAMNRLIKTKYAADLIQQIPTHHLMCMVEGTAPDEIDLYLGDDEGDHTTRVDTCRVTRDGRVWIQRESADLEEYWALIE